MRAYVLTCTLFLSAFPLACNRLPADDSADANDGTARDFRADMRAFVQKISASARGARPGFIIIPQNGHELLSLSPDEAGPPAGDYLAAIDGVGREDLFYGYEDDDRATPADVTAQIRTYLDLARGAGKTVLVTDYCADPARVDDSYARNAAAGYVSFAADRRELDDIPIYPLEPVNAGADDVLALSGVRNFVFVLSPESFASRGGYLAALRATRYDLLIIDLFYDGQPLSADEVESLRSKVGGGRRLVVCYLSIGEAEDYRYYWDPAWSVAPPPFLAGENPDFPGNFKVRYWDEAWQALIVGAGDAYLNRVLEAGFDGVYLDIIDAFEYFEDLAGAG